MKYRLGYLRAKSPTETETYEDKWFKFSHFKNMTVDIDEEDNRINIFGYIRPDGTYTTERSSMYDYSEIAVMGLEAPTPAVIPELKKDASGYFRLPGLPNLFHKIIPQSFTRVKLQDGSVAAIFIAEGKMSYANTIAPSNKIHACVIPSQNHLLYFETDLGCDPLYTKRQLAVVNQVLATFEIRSEWKWRTIEPFSDKKTQNKRASERFERLKKSVERMKQREALRRGPDSTAKCNTLLKNFGRRSVVQAFARSCV
jgi:hypothetical protein